jgi:hypothetical protein
MDFVVVTQFFVSEHWRSDDTRIWPKKHSNYIVFPWKSPHCTCVQAHFLSDYLSASTQRRRFCHCLRLKAVYDIEMSDFPHRTGLNRYDDDICQAERPVGSDMYHLHHLYDQWLRCIICITDMIDMIDMMDKWSNMLVSLLWLKSGISFDDIMQII